MDYGFRFREWNIYKDARLFRVEMEKIFRAFPKEEQYALVDQTKRALLSIILNIAESANKSTDKDMRLYINRAHCSLDEVVASFDCALDSGYINKERHEEILQKASNLAKQLNGFSGHLSKNDNSKSMVNGQKLTVNKSGFTLVELILYVALVGILLTAGAIFAGDVVLGSVKGRVRAKVQSEARFVIEKMRQEIVKGNNIILPIQGNFGNNFQIEIPGSPTSTLTCFQVSNSKFQMSEGGTVVPPVCNTAWKDLTSGEVEVSNLVFTNISSGTSLGEEAVKINMTLKNKNPGGKKEFDAEATVETSISLRL